MCSARSPLRSFGEDQQETDQMLQDRRWTFSASSGPRPAARRGRQVVDGLILVDHAQPGGHVAQ